MNGTIVVAVGVAVGAACSPGSEPDQAFADSTESGGADAANTSDNATGSLDTGGGGEMDDAGDAGDPTGADGSDPSDAGDSGDTGDAGETGGPDAGDSGVDGDNEYCKDVAEWDPDWTDHAVVAIGLINAARAEGRDCGIAGVMPPASELTREPALTCAARVHSADMATRDFFNHENPDGKDPSWRLEQAEFAGMTWSENIAGGYPTPEQVVEDWLAGDGNCAHLLDPQFTQIGLGYAYDEASTYAHYWTLLLGD